MIEEAKAHKIRLLVEEDPEGLLRVWYDPIEQALVAYLLSGRTWYARPTPPFMRYPDIVPVHKSIPFSAAERTRPFVRKVETTRIGSVTIFGPCEYPEGVAEAAQAARSPELDMMGEARAVASAVGTGYAVNIARDKTYLYREGL